MKNILAMLVLIQAILLIMCCVRIYNLEQVKYTKIKIGETTYSIPRDGNTYAFNKLK